MKRFEDQLFYSLVESGDVISKTEVIPKDETWQISKFIGSAAYDPKSRVCLVWGHGSSEPQLIRSTHGDVEHNLHFECVGDGAKALAIVLTNNSNETRSLGGGFEARVI